MAAASGSLAQIGIGSTATVDQRFDFIRESISKGENVIDANGLRGVFAHHLSRVRAGLQDVSGQIVVQPNCVELTYILPWIYGLAGSGTAYALSDAQIVRYLAIDRVTKVFNYTGCVIDRATFRASQGEPLEITLDVVGLTEGVPANAGTFPSISIDTATGPFVLSDCVASVDGTTVTARDIEIVVDNRVDRNRYFNSNTRVSAPKHDRIVTTRITLPYGDAAALYNSSSSVAGVRVLATYTNSAIATVSLIHDMKKVVFPGRSPMVEGRQEIMMTLEGQSFYSGSDAELITTLDSTVGP